MVGPEPEVTERLRRQQGLVRCMGTRSGAVGRMLDDLTVGSIEELEPQLVAASNHQHDQATAVTHRPWRVRAEIGEDGELVTKPRCRVDRVDHPFMSIKRPSSLRKPSGREALTMNARPPWGRIQASAVKSGGTTSSSSERTSAHSFGPRLAHSRRSAASAVSTIFSVRGAFLAWRRSVFGRWMGGRVCVLSGRAESSVCPYCTSGEQTTFGVCARTEKSVSEAVEIMARKFSVRSQPLYQP